MSVMTFKETLEANPRPALAHRCYRRWLATGNPTYAQLAFRFTLPVLSIQMKVMERREVKFWDMWEDVLQDSGIKLWEHINKKEFQPNDTKHYWLFYRRIARFALWGSRAKLLDEGTWEFEDQAGGAIRWALHGRAPMHPESVLTRMYVREVEQYMFRRTRETLRARLDGEEINAALVYLRMLEKGKTPTTGILRNYRVQLNRISFIVDLIRIHMRMALYEIDRDTQLFGRVQWKDFLIKT